MDLSSLSALPEGVAEALGLIDGLSLDYIGGLNGKGLVFNNPKSVDTCGCGTSFSA